MVRKVVSVGAIMAVSMLGILSWQHIAMVSMSNIVYFSNTSKCYLSADTVIKNACNFGIKANQAQCELKPEAEEKYNASGHTLVEYWVGGENYFVDPTHFTWLPSEDINTRFGCGNKGGDNWVVNTCSAPNCKYHECGL